MKQYKFITVQAILNELKEYSCNMDRLTLYDLEVKLGYYDPTRRTVGNWRKWNEAQKTAFIVAILNNYSREIPKKLQEQINPAVNQTIKDAKKRLKTPEYQVLLEEHKIKRRRRRGYELKKEPKAAVHVTEG